MSEPPGMWENLPMLTKAASLFFILGKVVGFMTFFTFFANLMLAKWMLMVYAMFIGISIFLSGYQMFRKGKRDNKPTRQQVEEWAREYRLLEGK